MKTWLRCLGLPSREKISSEQLAEPESKHTGIRHLVAPILLIVTVAIVVALPFVMNRPQTGPSAFDGGLDNGMQIAPVHRTLSAVKGNSTLVAHISVTGVEATYPIIDYKGEPTGIVSTVFRLSVVSYVKGSGPQIIYLATQPLPGYPLPVTGQEYVFFLVNGWTGCSPSTSPPCSIPPTPLEITFFTTGGPQGRFLVQNGLVYGFKTLYPEENDWVKVDANAIPLDQFLATVQNA